MKEVKLMMSFYDTDAIQMIASFSDEDLEILQQYCEHSERLRQTRIVKDGLFYDVTIRWTKEAGVRIDSPEPSADFELIASFLHYFRPIFLKKEPASFERVAGIIGRRFSHKTMKRQLSAIRALAETSPFHAYGQITIADVPLWDYGTLQKWLYAFEYHQDTDKREYLKDVKAELNDDGIRAVFLQQLQQQTLGYFRLEDLARTIIECPDVK